MATIAVSELEVAINIILFLEFDLFLEFEEKINRMKQFAWPKGPEGY